MKDVYRGLYQRGAPGLVGRVGRSGMVHHLLEVDEGRTWGKGACKQASGALHLLGPYHRISCPVCISLHRNGKVKATTTIGKIP
jgi:hypothetical protein